MANYSKDCQNVLERLATSKNVLISGPPGTGKTRLLSEIAQAFSEMLVAPVTPMSPPLHAPGARVAIPAPLPVAAVPGLAHLLPALRKSSRQVFRTVFHQNTRHRDFATGLMPNVSRTPGDPDFIITVGTLIKASEYAKGADAASLLIIDEINRGPAVQIFGGAIVAMEADKRLAPDGRHQRDTQYFDLLHPTKNLFEPYALPDDLYIIAALNQADASVEPLDVAFLRRWEPYILDPDITTLRTHLGIEGAKAVVEDLPAVPTETKEVFEASVRAWEKVNKRVSLGRGAEFQIGHGILMAGASPSMPLEQALRVCVSGWAKVRAHIQEVFFGDTRGIAAVLNSVNPPVFHPLKLQEATFGDDFRYQLQGPTHLDEARIYDAMRAISL
ncbi:5-methylcytosine-specific restriction protein B [Hymenobacter sp. UYP22]